MGLKWVSKPDSGAQNVLTILLPMIHGQFTCLDENG